jgi:hypothetical protein
MIIHRQTVRAALVVCCSLALTACASKPHWWFPSKVATTQKVTLISFPNARDPDANAAKADELCRREGMRAQPSWHSTEFTPVYACFEWTPWQGLIRPEPPKPYIAPPFAPRPIGDFEVGAPVVPAPGARRPAP